MEIKSMRLGEDVLFNVVRLLEITGNNYREDFNKCEVDCKTW